MGKVKISNSDSGLKILFVSNTNTPERHGDNPFLINEIAHRYEIVTPASLSFDYSCHEQLDSKYGWAKNLGSLTTRDLIFADYYGNGLFPRIVRVLTRHLRLGHIRQLFDTSYVALHLLKLVSSGERSGRLLLKLKLIVIGTIDARIKAAANDLVSSDIALVLMSPDTSATQRFFMLASALRSRIPISFPSAQASPRENLTCLTRRVEPTAHNAVRLRRNSDIKSISAIYGAKAAVAEYCGLHIEEACIPGFWMHGWIPSYHNVHPAFIALHKREIPGVRVPWSRDPIDTSDVQLVARADQEDFLRKHGYTNVKAIGLPIVYLEQPASSQVRGSLLVVPPHGNGWRGENDLLVQEYVEYISSLKTNFSVIRVCITVNDYVKKDWWPAFEKAGIDNIVSVDRSDPRAIHRLRHIMSRFEYVTTNSYGSAIAYAAFSGCKISISGPYADVPVELLKKAHAVVHFPELFEKQVELCSERALRSHYPELFVEPEHAIERIAWGRWELGYKHRLSKDQMRTLLRQGCREDSI